MTDTENNSKSPQKITDTEIHSKEATPRITDTEINLKNPNLCICIF